MQHNIRHLIEHNFAVVMLVACAAGLWLPGLPLLPNETAVGLLAALMFVSCYKLGDGNYKSFDWKHAGTFYLLRYALLPPLLWGAAKLVAPSYATSVFLLSMVPAGVSSPAIAAIYGGAVAPGFAIVILSQMAAPLLIPLQFAWQGGSVAVSPMALFGTMVWCIVVPMVVYYAVRGHARVRDYFYRNNKLFSILLVCFIIALAVSKQRDVILGGGDALIVSFVISMLCFMLFIIFGWAVARRLPREERITYAACSGFNNAALGVSLALLHFTPDVILFVAVSEIAWSTLPLMMRAWLYLRPSG